MPIEVHCPNPVCAKVHIVKDKYAGQRGKCPACSHWMYVPQPPARLEESATDYVEDVGRSMQIDDQLTQGLLPQGDKPLPTSSEPTPSLADQAQPAPETPPRRFPWAAAALVLLGVVGLGSVAASPYLDRPTVGATGEMATKLEGKQPKGIDPQYASIVTGVAGGVAAACLLSLLTWRLGFLSRVLLYLGTIGSAVLLFVGVSVFRSESLILRALLAIVDREKQGGTAGEASPWLGPQLYAAVGGAGLACLCLLLAAIVLHRRWWSRMLAFVVLGAVVAFGPVWAFREELGIRGRFPPEWEEYIPF